MPTTSSPTGHQRVRVAADAVVSAYIHEISHRPNDGVRSAATVRARPGPRLRGVESARSARPRARGDRPLSLRSGRPLGAPQPA